MTRYQYLSRQLIRLAMRVAPCERQAWAQAMSAEMDAIPSDLEALSWALGCLQASCHWRLKSMRPTDFWLVRWSMALWVALVACDALAYAGFTLNYKLGLSTAQYPYPLNIRLLGVTPLWDPILTLIAGVMLLLAVILIFRRKSAALAAVATPFVVLLLLFAIRVSRPESHVMQSLSAMYQESPFEMIWPAAGFTITILICFALWRDRQTPAPR
jgi:hypothetical protein